MTVPSLAPGIATGVGLGVTLGGLSFNQNNTDSNGVTYYLSSLDGWDAPDLRDELTLRPMAHGAYRGPSFYGARSLTLKGVVVSPARLDLLRLAKDALAYESDLTDTDGVLTVYESPAKAMLVRRSGRLRLAQVGQHAVRWEIDLTAADPRKYAAAERSLTLLAGDTQYAENAGTFRGGAPMRIVMDGSGTVAVGSQLLTLAAGSAVVTVDTLEATVDQGGTSGYYRLGAGSVFPMLPARATTPVSFAGSGTVSLYWRDAWV